jgi:hypothetical protein
MVWLAVIGAWLLAGQNEQNGPVRALANGVSGANGVYKAGASGFPTDTWSASNYWVDVVFTTSAL